jgi:hypothetical protein
MEVFIHPSLRNGAEQNRDMASSDAFYGLFFVEGVQSVSGERHPPYVCTNTSKFPKFIL